MTGERRVGVAFDLDGTLVHLPVDTGAVRRRLGELFSPLGYRGFFDPVLEKIDEAVTQISSEREKHDALRQRARSIIDEEERRAARQARPLEMARQTVQGLNRRGYPLGIVTNTGRAALGEVLAMAGLADIPWVTANTRDDVSAAKPRPEGLIGAARALVPGGGTLWFVGASVEDIVAGHEANRAIPGVDVRTVAVLTDPRTPSHLLRASRPDHTIPRLDQLTQLVIANW